MKIELTINVEYLPEWKAFEGIRELLQNGKDAETEHNARLTVRHRKDKDVLIIENEGVVISHEALLFGTTSKTGRDNMIGAFGEGLKLGMLALVRAGHSVKIRSGSEVWIPSIQRSEKFKADVLVVDIQAGRKDEARVQVEVGGVTAETWDRMRECFLFLPDVLGEKEHVPTSCGQLLMGERFRGRVYVKGIFVQSGQTTFGYNLTSGVTVDRDRKMVSTFDLHYYTAVLWREALARRPDLVGPFMSLLDNQTEDVVGLEGSVATSFPEKVRRDIAAEFQTRHGTEAIPVGNLSESADAAHYGRTGIVVSKPAKALLESVVGSLTSVKQSLATEEQHIYGWHELSDTDRDNLTRAIRLINGLEPLSLDQVKVVDYRDEKLQGLYQNGAISVAKHVLTSRQVILETLVHEVAHRYGLDHEEGHITNMERIWSGIVEALSLPAE